jgi:hypothetical protein
MSLQLGRFEKIRFTADRIEIVMSIEDLDSFIKQYYPSAKLEKRDDELYIVLPLNSILSYELENDKVKIVMSHTSPIKHITLGSSG